MKKQLQTAAAIVVGVLVLAAPASAAPLLIDSFGAPPGGLTLTDLPGGGGAAALTADAGILGGWRSVELAASGAGGVSQASVNVVPNALALANDPGVASHTILTYDANASGLGNLDLFLGLGLDSFRLGLEFADLASSLAVTLYDGATIAQAVISLPATLTPQSISVLFTDFTVIGAGNPFGSLDRIQVALNAPAGAEVILKQFEFATGSVPEPPAAMLFGVFLLGVALSRRVFGTPRA